jgi:hypothetical protein
MTIEAKVNSLVVQFIEQSRARTEAWRKLNVPEYNRRVKQVVEIAKALRSLPDGRRALVALMSDADPYSPSRCCLSLPRSVGGERAGGGIGHNT